MNRNQVKASASIKVLIIGLIGVFLLAGIGFLAYKIYETNQDARRRAGSNCEGMTFKYTEEFCSDKRSDDNCCEICKREVYQDSNNNWCTTNVSGCYKTNAGGLCAAQTTTIPNISTRIPPGCNCICDDYKANGGCGSGCEFNNASPDVGHIAMCKNGCSFQVQKLGPDHVCAKCIDDCSGAPEAPNGYRIVYSGMDQNCGGKTHTKKIPFTSKCGICGNPVGCVACYIKDSLPTTITPPITTITPPITTITPPITTITPPITTITPPITITHLIPGELSINKKGSATCAYKNAPGRVKYTITVSYPEDPNKDLPPITYDYIKDTLDDRIQKSWVKDISNGGVFNNGAIEWPGGTIKEGESFNLTYTVEIPLEFAGTYKNTAVIRYEEKQKEAKETVRVSVCPPHTGIFDEPILMLTIGFAVLMFGAWEARNGVFSSYFVNLRDGKLLSISSPLDFKVIETKKQRKNFEKKFNRKR